MSTESITQNEACDVSIGQRIRFAREEAGLSVERLANQIGVEGASVAAWENGERAPRANRIRMLSGVLNVSLVWLLQGGDDQAPVSDPMTVELLRQRMDRIRLLLNEGLNLLDDTEDELAKLRQDGKVGDEV